MSLLTLLFLQIMANPYLFEARSMDNNTGSGYTTMLVASMI
jgi:hypothetical protein